MLPFSESSVAMVVSVKHDERNNMWIFLKPLSWGLWLTIGAAFMLTEERVVNNWSRFVLIVWVLAVLIITQSYAGSLASILTVQRLQPAFLDVNEIKRNNYSVGYQNGSFLKGFLIAELGFNESKLKPCDSPEDYHHALLLGCKNGAGVAAIFGETFFLNLFLQKYGSRYKMVGPTYNTGGFGFAFPKKSPLVSYISRAILEVTEDKDKFGNITKKYFPDGIVHGDQSDSISSDCPSLTLKSFGGLFIITFGTSLLCLLFNVLKFFCSKWPAMKTSFFDRISFWMIISHMAKSFFLDRSRLSNGNNPRDPSSSPGRNGDDMENHQRTHNQEVDNITVNE
ncbi:hypothetical protein L6164_000951 [Bauhinia variegata]|uniref:Uncharacterized protein n=1 Tax=Bauhinia variegata TaxID=167791 RepID=A0ACB9QA71_BAUVA|nr:hypothetical protein L6164_000951 [Bauhinia variegata]